MAKNRDNRNRVDHYTRQTIRLFEDRDRKQRDIIAEVAQTIPWNEAWSSSSHSSYTSPLFVISPTAKRTMPIPPNAPIKPRKPFSKEGLKPKKLRFTDKEKDEAEDENYSEESIDLSTMFKQKTKFSKKQGETGKLDHENLNTMLQSMRLELENKENRQYGQEQHEKRARNNRSIIKEHARNNSSSQSSKLIRSPKDFEKYSFMAVPQYTDTISTDVKMSKEETLLWLQSQRDVGMFIECCRKTCKKWRYCDDFHDPVDVPKRWYCKMNSDKTIASCFVPEVPQTEAVEEDLIENKYNSGSLVWGHMRGYPWWPAIIDDCPETLRYYELKGSSIIPVKYHVTFFKDDIIHTWLNSKSIRAFTKCKKSTIMKKNKFYKINDKKPLEKAYTLAQSAIPLSIFERLQRFSYISRLKNMRESVSQLDEEEDNEIPSTPLESNKRMTLKEFCLKNRHYTKNNFL